MRGLRVRSPYVQTSHHVMIHKKKGTYIWRSFMKRFRHWMSKGTPWPWFFLNQNTLRNSMGCITPQSTWVRSNGKEDTQNQRYYAPSLCNLITLWEHTLIRPVTGYQNVQVLVPLIVLGKILGKPQWTQRLLIQYKWRRNQVINTIYLISTII